MELKLGRRYHPTGTNGIIWLGPQVICSTIELPWKDNMVGASCIPEGVYQIKRRYSKRFGWHIEVVDVPHRSYILFHPANNALRELRGCIAPVTKLTGFGVGTQSRNAMQLLKNLVYKAFENEPVHLNIKAIEDYETN